MMRANSDTTSKLLALLLSNNGEDTHDTHKLKFNHQALALWLKQFKAQRNAHQVFLAGGPTDLTALLPKLCLYLLGDEAFILVSTNKHFMLIYLRVEIEGIYAGIFDSKDWGLSSIPKRLIIESLINNLPKGSKIYLSGHSIQNPDLRPDCIEYSLACLDYLSQHSNQFFKEIRQHSLEPLTHPSLPAACMLQLAEQALPQKLLNQLKAAFNTYPKLLHQLSALIESNYVCSLGLDWNKINQTVNELHGCNLVATFPTPALYAIEVDLMHARISISLPIDHLYSNFLAYSNQEYVEAITVSTTQFIFSEYIQVSYDHSAQLLIYTFTDLKELTALVNRINPDDYYPTQMQQKLALSILKQQLIDAVEEAIELDTMQHNQREFDHRQTLFALLHLFAVYRSQIYVPSLEELTEAYIDLDQLKNYRHLAFTFFLFPKHLITSNHESLQIAVWIQLDDGDWRVTVVTNTEREKAEEIFLHAQKILTHQLKSKLAIKFQLQSCFETIQSTDWLPTLNLVNSLCIMANQRLIGCNLPHIKTAENNQSSILRKYYAAFKQQEKLETIRKEQHKKINQDLASFQQAIMKINSEVCTQAEKNDTLNELETFISEARSQEKYHRNTNQALSLDKLRASYNQRYPQDKLGNQLFHLAVLYQGEHELIKKMIEKISPFLLQTPKTDLRNQMNLFCGHQLSMYLDQSNSLREKLQQIKELINLYFGCEPNYEAQLIRSMLHDKLEYFDAESEAACMSSINAIDPDPRVQLSLLTHLIINELIMLKPTYKAHEARLSLLHSKPQQKQGEEEQHNQAERIRGVLHRSGLTIGHNICLHLAKNQYAFNFIYLYVKDFDFFVRSKHENTCQLIRNLINLSSYLDLFSALHCYLIIHPQENFSNLVHKYISAKKPNITHREIKNWLSRTKPAKRLDLIIALKAFIRNLIRLLDLIPLQQRPIAIANLSHAIKDPYDLSLAFTLIEDKPELKQLLFIRMLHKVSEINLFIKFLINQPHELRRNYALSYVLNCNQNAIHEKDITLILQQLNRKDHIQFARNTIEHFKECPGYAENMLFELSLMHYPKLKTCRKLASDFLKTIQSFKELVFLLHYVELKDLFTFALQNVNRLIAGNLIKPVDTQFFALDQLINLLAVTHHDQELLTKIKITDVQQLLLITQLTKKPDVIFTLISTHLYLFLNKKQLKQVLTLVPPHLAQEIKKLWSKTMIAARIPQQPKMTNLRKIIDINGYYNPPGYLKIKPGNLQILKQSAEKYPHAFYNFHEGIELKNWRIQDDASALIDLIKTFLSGSKKFRYSAEIGFLLKNPGILSCLHNLAEMNLTECILDDQSADMLLRAISNPKKMQNMHLRGNCFSLEKIEEIKQLFSHPYIRISFNNETYTRSNVDTLRLYQLGLLYLQQAETSRSTGSNSSLNSADFSKAMRCFKLLAQAGYSEAQFSLGKIYIKGINGLPNRLKAFKWFSFAAKQMHDRAQNNTGLILLEGCATIPRNPALALKYFRQAAEQGNAQAYYNLFHIHKKGLLPGVISREQALTWLQKAAALGSASAQSKLGHLYLQGYYGLEKNEGKALTWLKLAKAQNEINAFNLLGYIHTDHKKYSKALKFIELGCNQGDSNSFLLLMNLQSLLSKLVNEDKEKCDVNQLQERISSAKLNFFSASQQTKFNSASYQHNQAKGLGM